jgi:hypothetical protein
VGNALKFLDKRIPLNFLMPFDPEIDLQFRQSRGVGTLCNAQLHNTPFLYTTNATFNERAIQYCADCCGA